MRIGFVVPILPLFGMLVACSSGPPSPKPGSPAFFWAVARESYRTGDLAKTNATLLELSRNPNEFTARARVWQLVVSAGLSQGYSELADAYESGATINLTSPQRFHTQATTLRSMAASAALDFAQAVQETVENNKDADILLAFMYPSGATATPEGLDHISDGMWASDSEKDSVETAMLQRGVALAVERAVGQQGDRSKAVAVFQTPEVRIPRSTFLYGMAGLLYEESELFSPQRMDRPNKLVLMCREALDTLKSLPQTDQTAALAAKIQDTIKKYGGA